jgi:alkylation response protein AidB-like acyl-CoA dehydrogenase
VIRNRGAADLERLLDDVARRPLDTPQDVAAALRELVQARVLELPLPGSGHTSQRYSALAEIAATNLSLARLAEGHTDALAILAEARHRVGPGTYGVWAAEPPDARLTAERTPTGYVLRGKKRYASGARHLSRALVTADGGRLFDVDLESPLIRAVPGTWSAVGMAATESLEVVFDAVPIDETACVGGTGFYLVRPGFWQGAVGVAACWYGGALGACRMLRALLASGKPNDHQLAHLGAVAASCATMQAVLDDAARALDTDPLDHENHGETRALVVRQVIEHHCQDVLTRVGRASGSSALVFDLAHARRAADLVVYLRQHHAERDLAALGRAVLACN